MSNTARTYLLFEESLRQRMVPSAITGAEAPLSVPEWLKTKPDCDRLQNLLDLRGAGVRFVTYLHRAGWYSEFDQILESCPDLKPRNTPVDYVEHSGMRFETRKYQLGSEFPAGYQSFLTEIDCSGWQFFSYEEMAFMVPAIEKFLQEQESYYIPEWEEVILDHHEHNYDLFLIVHML